jgi:hypothetical protein
MHQVPSDLAHTLRPGRPTTAMGYKVQLLHGPATADSNVAEAGSRARLGLSRDRPGSGSQLTLELPSEARSVG